ncbi:glycosyltransferase [Kutzneria buriramensis]|uniref:glycosyltransferase n=1 Tax=Kutzneria buriramensis TaxID=1045776 RepID=UPI0035EF4807
MAVVVPARDEEETVGECLRAVHAAIWALPPSIRSGVCVVADQCCDDTADIAWPEVLVSNANRPLGTVRDLGVRRLLTDPAEECWILNTDADSVVPRDWIRAHLRLADQGAHAVAGDVEIDGWGRDHSRRERIYGANLGVRGDVYRAVGGFGPLSTGEDQHLWDRIKLAGYRTVTTPDAPVRTSGRVHGRARGGLADLLREQRSA